MSTQPFEISNPEVVIRRSERIGELVGALAKAQLEFDPITKDQKNPYYGSKYADLSNVISATQKPLAKNSLVILQQASVDVERQRVTVTSTLAHSSDQWIENELTLPAIMVGKDGKPRFDAQSCGAAMTYGRRYSYQGLAGVAAELDDDGNAAIGEKGSVEAAQAVAQEKIAALKAKIPMKPAPPSQDLTQKLQESIAATQKPSGHADPFNDGPLDTRPLITKAEMGKKGGKAENMLFIEYDGEKATVFDKSWFPYMKAGVPADLDLETVKVKGKSYVNVKAIHSVGDTKAGPDHKPALDVNRPAGAAFDQQVADISAEGYFDPFQEAEAGLL